MAHKPVGKLKRYRSEEMEEDDEILERSSSNFSKKKILKSHGKTKTELLSAAPTMDRFFALTATRKPNSKVPMIVKSSSIASSSSKSENVREGLNRAASLRDDTSPQSKSPNHVLDFSQAKVLGRKELSVAIENVTRKQAANHQHDFEGVKVKKRMSQQDPDDLDKMVFTMFETYTLRLNNQGLPERELDELWMYYMRYVTDFVVDDLFPNRFLLYAITHSGLNHHHVRVRFLCEEFLTKLITCHHPPSRQDVRLRYLELFFRELPDDRDIDVSMAWEYFIQLLEQYASPDVVVDGSARLLTFLVKVLEMDFFHWQYQSFEKGKCLKSPPLISIILWSQNDSNRVNYRVKKILQLYVETWKIDDGKRTEIFRRLVSIIANFIGAEETERKSILGKSSLIDHLSQEIRRMQNNLEDEDLWSELFLMAPDWLAMEISRNFTVRNNCDTFGGIRGIATAISQIDLSKLEENSAIEITNNNHVKIRLNKYGESPLHIACRKGNMTKVETLLKGMDPSSVSLPDYGGWTAMHEAVKYNRPECLKLLLDHSTSFAVVLTKGGDEQITPLHEAVLSNKPALVEMILDRMSCLKKLETTLDCLTNAGQTLDQISSNDAMKLLLFKYSNRLKTSETAPVPIAQLAPLPPPKLAIWASTFLQRYVATFRLHAVKKVMKGFHTNFGQSHPMIQLCFLHPNRPSIPTNSIFTQPVICVSTDNVARNISTYWKLVSKDDFFSPLVKILCENKVVSK